MKDGTTERLELASPEHAVGAAERMFQTLRAELAAILPSDAVIEHVGATAVSGCLTKGDLDISVQVSPEAFAAADRALSRVFERNLGSVCTDRFSAFKRDHIQPPIGVQLVVRGAPLDVFVRFRDRLREDPKLTERYNALKRSHEGAEMNTYRAAKSAFIASVLGLPGDEPGAE
ncbi:GrpB family protein [Cupriavidus sp. KK10]|jgi:GrpB-like predicted nucleotidyltransferase (UPF0157 family)|uniref:GrpB family protein n=1 Tax=Cupriavidus sp. KK10 TaxID=1478019 RepID=UPI001BADF8A7|nr:GrpB family protein [Cupriavidus sp. KK10]QUN29323.1 GrpB family protein [Cupriavidus sp. KK10]